MFADFPISRLFLSLLVGGLLASGAVAGQELTFKSSADRVTVAVVARDHNGRPMRGLSPTDFQIFDDGQPREILDFRNDASAVSVALLLDTSGSMRIPPKLQLATELGHLLLASMSEGLDEAALFVFDKSVHLAHPFTTRFEPLQTALESAHPFGSTSLYDAIAETAQQLSTHPGRRALVVLTDGVDTSSQLTAAEVSGIASAIDMPVYIVAAGKSMDGLSTQRTANAEDASVNLRDLARWSGGAFYSTATAADSSGVARQIIADLRHQYLLAFEPKSSPGWHRIEVRAHQRMTLQARSGYWIGPADVRQ